MTMRATHPSPIQFRAATSADWPEIAALLTAAILPLAGAREHLDHFVLAVSGNRPVGCAGLEVYGEDALLRSVAVDEAWRGRGLGTALVEQVLGRARQHGVARVHLLTTTAADFFARLGFRAVARADLPTALQASEELRGACPEGAVAMTLDLADAPATSAWTPAGTCTHP